MSDRYLIWSHEHHQWWGPDRCGYTDHVAAAGRYSFEEAGAIVVPNYPPGIEVAVPEITAERTGNTLVFGIKRGEATNT